MGIITKSRNQTARYETLEDNFLSRCDQWPRGRHLYNASPCDHPGVAEILPHSGLEANHLFNGVTNTSFPSLPGALLKHKLKDIVGAGNLVVFEPAKNSREAIELQIGRPRSWAYGGNHSQRVRPRPVVTPVDRLVELQISRIPIPIQRTR